MKEEERKAFTSLKRALQYLAQTGRIESPLSDIQLTEVIDTFGADQGEPSRNEIRESIRRAQTYLARKAVGEAQEKNKISSVLPFGRTIQFWRTRTELTRTRLARFLKSDVDYISRIEEGVQDPLKCPADLIAKLLDFFNLTLSNFRASLVEHSKASALRQGHITALPRSSHSKGSGDEVELSLAIEQLLKATNDQTTESVFDLPRRFEEQVKAEIRRLGRPELLK